jgi:phytoene dehydrogenase-like protein
MADAIVVGAGPNGLVAANLLADRGWDVLVLEAASEPGGAVRSAELTGQPGFVHDVFSAFYPFAVASPAIRGLDLEAHGLQWCHGRYAVAHPASDGTCVVLSPRLEETMASVDAFAPGDGEAWRRLFGIWERVGAHVVQALVTPFPPVRPSLRIAAKLGPDVVRFARLLALPMRRLAEEEFRGAGAARLIAAHAAHADLPPEVPPSGAFGWVLAALGQEHGFPTPRGGAGELTAALVRRLQARGGTLRCDAPVTRVVVRGRTATGVEVAGGERIEARRAVLADVGAPVLYRDLVGPEHLPSKLLADLERFQYDWATVKVDWALDAPIPWAAEPAREAGVIHVADDIDELTMGGAQIATGLLPAKPFLVMGQYATVDRTRSPPGTDTAWAYTHVPRAVRGDAGGEGLTGAWADGDGERLAERIEARIEALAPGFRGVIRARHVLAPPDFERADPNLVLGSMHAGTAQLHQQAIFRPTPGSGRPETPVARLYLASASAHPGGGVHGGPGANAARAVLGAEMRRRLSSPAGWSPRRRRPRRS